MSEIDDDDGFDDDDHFHQTIFNTGGTNQIAGRDFVSMQFGDDNSTTNITMEAPTPKRECRRCGQAPMVAVSMVWQEQTRRDKSGRVVHSSQLARRVAPPRKPAKPDMPERVEVYPPPDPQPPRPLQPPPHIDNSNNKKQLKSIGLTLGVGFVVTAFCSDVADTGLWLLMIIPLGIAAYFATKMDNPEHLKAQERQWQGMYRQAQEDEQSRYLEEQRVHPIKLAQYEVDVATKNAEYEAEVARITGEYEKEVAKNASLYDAWRRMVICRACGRRVVLHKSEA